MVPADLSKPGRQHVEDEGKRFRVYAHRFSCLEIERLSDGATLFLQGEDADSLAYDLSLATSRRIRANLTRLGTTPCDHVCAEYSEILQLPES